MRLLIALACAVLLTACATPTQQPKPVGAKPSSGLIVAGTLSLGECEMSIAPLYSRAAVAAERARRRLTDGRLTPEQGAEIKRRGLALLAVLDGVCKLEKQGKSAGAAHNVHYVRDVALPELESLITGAGK